MPVKKVKKKSQTAERKKRTREHVIADLSANYVERFALLDKCSVECVGHDYGYDLNVYTYDYNTGEFENGNINIQLKATDKLTFVNKKTQISFPIDRSDLKTWYYEPYPAILIVYDASSEKGYWCYLQQSLRLNPKFDINKKGRSFNIRISKKNVVDKDTFKKLRGFKLNTLKEIQNAPITYK